MGKESSQKERNKVPDCRNVVLRTRYQQHRQYPENKKKKSAQEYDDDKRNNMYASKILTPRFQIYTSRVNDVSAIFVENITFLFPLGVGENTRSCTIGRNRTIWWTFNKILILKTAWCSTLPDLLEEVPSIVAQKPVLQEKWNEKRMLSIFSFLWFHTRQCIYLQPLL